MPNKTEALDLYAKIEGLLENREAISELYSIYLKQLDGMAFDSLLDVGCGSGGFLELIQRIFSPSQLKGIDLSPVMVARTAARGIDAEAIDLCDLDGRFEVITAVFDMVNYLDREGLKRFMQCIHERLVPGGYFLCDVNSEYGFAEIASGSFTAEDDGQFLVIDSAYEEGVYHSDFTLFEKEGSCYRRSDEQILQYYHQPEQIAKAGSLTLAENMEVMLYSDVCDKHFLVFQKEK